MTTGDKGAGVDLYWLPLGAGGRCVKLNGRAYEWLVSRREHRERKALYHSALIIHAEGVTWTVEMGPVWNVDAPDTAAVCTGAVGARWLRRFRAFRYEVRCWEGGYIPDIDEAQLALRLTDSKTRALATLAAVHRVPSLTWGRDEACAGEMWNSNSVIAWVLASSGYEMSDIGPPAGGRAPGWDAGLVLFARQQRPRALSPALRSG